MEIDYSGLVEDVPAQQQAWRAPRHVYFGKRDQNSGQMEEEPVYSHKAFPAYFYKMKEGRIIPRVVKNEEELAAVKADGWFDTPAKLGYIGAPSFDEAQKMRAAMEASDAAPEPIVPPERVNARSRAVKQEI
jgi:hypothetical protein